MRYLTIQRLLSTAALAWTLLFAAPLTAQVMSFSVYTDAYATNNNDTIVTYTSVSDNSTGCSHSNYVTHAQIYSPSGRNSSAQGGSLYATTSIAFNGEEGTYSIAGYGTYYCQCSFQNFGFGGGQNITLSLRTSIFTNPSEAFYGCYYGSLACSSGSATCGSGWTLSTLGHPCPQYASAAFLVINFGTYHICSLGLSAVTSGPAPCT